MFTTARSVVVSLACAAALAALPDPALAQYRPPADPSTGERYHVELSGVLWNPNPSLLISSESLGIPGDPVNLVSDLGITQKRLPEFRVVLRPAPKHKFRFNYMPMRYDAESQVTREFVFNAQRYRIGLPVNTTADLTTYRFGYEYDFFYRDRGYAGVLVDLKYTQVDVLLDSPIGEEFFRAPAPIPTIGFTGRGYVVPSVSITGEVSFFKVPENVGRENFGGRYMDYDFYGTYNFHNNAGVQMGYRSVDVNYFADRDTGDLKFSGWYMAAVLRF